jgi:tRNA A-37 threonylcarbamoyl transferase component Bud32
LPADWHLYASLTCYPKNQAPIEIDALLVIDDRVLLLELKDWNGELASLGDRWTVDGRPRGRSPVALLAEKARKVKTILGQRSPQLRRFYYDFRVVLTGGATAANLSADDQRHTLSLAHAQLLSDPTVRRRLLGPVTLPAVRPNTLGPEFDRVLANPKLFRASQMNWDGYGIYESDLFVHPRGVWREHGVQQYRDPRIKALLRQWQLDRLPQGLNSPETRRLVAERELRIIGLLRQAESSVIADGAILQPSVGSPDEILTDHYEILALPTNWTTLRRYIEKNRSSFAMDQRLDAIGTLLGIGAELHNQGVAHRDLAPSCVWLVSPSRIALTGFMSAQVTADESVGDWLDALRGYSVPTPEDGDRALGGTAWQRDVYQLGQIAREVATLGEEAAVLPPDVAAVLDKATAYHPGERYADAQAFADAFGTALSPSEIQIDQSRLDAHETADIPFVRWLADSATLDQNERRTAYVSHADDGDRVVKIWTSVRRGQSQALDLAMLAMFEGGGRLMAAPADCLPQIEAAALSPVGPFLVCRRAEGTPLSAWLAAAPPSDPAEVAAVVAMFGSAVDTLHGLGCAHGDLSPDNILLAGEGADRRVRLIDLFDLHPAGSGAVRNLAYAPADWERLSVEQIDRYGVVRIAQDLVSAAGAESLPALDAAIARDLERPSVETLTPLLAAARHDLDVLRAPPVPTFTLTAPGLPDGELTPDGGVLYAQIRRFHGGRAEYRISGIDRLLLLRMQGTLIERCAIEPLPFDALRRRGTPLALRLRTANGSRDEVGALVAFLEETFPDIEPAPEEAKPGRAGDLAVAELWRTLIGLEEEFIPSVVLGDRIADTGENAIFEYEAERPFDFDSETDVEVRTRDGGRGRLIGKLDLRDLSDRTLAIRLMSHPPFRGEPVSLVDRRERESIDRRRRGVERILEGRSEIPDLIEYFEPGCDKTPTHFDLVPSDAELAVYGLNVGQRDAFRAILSQGPLGLLQGPPGTGKTRFIGALVHWLVTVAGARKILVASQSHEAVNGAAEELIKLFGARGDKLALLRVGAKGLTSRLRPYHSTTLRERYRQRFDGGLKARLVAAGVAAGVARALLSDLVDLDRSLGTNARRLQLFAEMLAAPDITPDETRRVRDRARLVSRSFTDAAPAWVGRDVDLETEQAVVLVDEAHQMLLARHPRSTPADLMMARRLLALSREWSETLGSGHRNFEEFLAKTRTVIAGTCVGLGQTRIRLEAGSFDWVIVDEAARCTAGELAVPLQLGRRVLLVGDHLQLPPMIDKPMVEAAEEALPRVPKPEIVRSDFERAFTSSYGKGHGRVLSEQYRMVEPICDLVSDTFYAPRGVRLVTSRHREADPRFERHLPDLLARPVTWIDTRRARNAVESGRSQKWKWNEAEVEAVIALLGNIAAEQEFAASLADDEEQAIGIICMYKKQKQEIERRFAQSPFDAAFRRTVKIDTVDSYQGKENAIVIVSLVRANEGFDPGHVRSRYRCNVALSRARERLYIVGHGAMWSDPRCRSPMRSIYRQIQGMDDAVAKVGGMEAFR